MQRPRPRHARRAVRRWKRKTVGMVGPADVVNLAKKVDEYRSRLSPFVVNAPLTPAPSSSPFTIIDWQSLDRDVTDYVSASANVASWNPIDYMFAGGGYRRGRELVAALDLWQGELVRLGVRNVPQPLPVPDSELDLAGGVGFALAALLGIFLLKDFG